MNTEFYEPPAQSEGKVRDLPMEKAGYRNYKTAGEAALPLP